MAFFSARNKFFPSSGVSSSCNVLRMLSMVGNTVVLLSELGANVSISGVGTTVSSADGATVGGKSKSQSLHSRNKSISSLHVEQQLEFIKNHKKNVSQSSPGINAISGLPGNDVSQDKQSPPARSVLTQFVQASNGS